MKKHTPRLASLVLLGLLLGLTPALAPAQPDATSIQPASDLTGRRVEDVRVLGNIRVPTSVILNQVRTREGDAFDPKTVEEDYHRIYSLRRFSNVEAKVEPTDTGVIVIFVVHETNLVRSVAFRGNRAINTLDLEQAADVRVGQAIDSFRLSMARRAIQDLYRDKNYPFTNVEVLSEPLERGDVIFRITEGPNVRIRKVRFEGNESIPANRLMSQIGTRSWVFIFRPGTYDPDLIDDDVAALRQYYVTKGFFDVRVGRKLTFSPDQTEVMVTFVIEEGPRYTVNRVIFRGNQAVGEQRLREKLRLVEGRPYDVDLIRRDMREMVRAYSPLGYIYDPQQQREEYLSIRDRTVFRQEPGQVDLIYEIHEGRPFRVGGVIVKGNQRSQDKLVLRELRVAPGQLYDSAELQDAVDRLRSGPYFSQATITPVGDDPEVRDIVVEVVEKPTASFHLGAGFNTNGGVGGYITYQQANFDITNWPASTDDLFSDRAFMGAGQLFRVSLEPGTVATNASVLFIEPYLFDQPYSFSAEAYLRNRVREKHDERRTGGQIGFGRRFDNVWSAQLTLRGEDVSIRRIHDPALRAPEIVALRGHSTLTSVGVQLRRNTTNPGFLLYEGTNTQIGWERVGALGGDFHFHRLTGSFNWYIPLYEDLLERRTVLSLHANAGYITGGAPFFERFYGGGIGSVRGFAYRGISPRAGRAKDPVGGDFMATFTAEVSFPLAGDALRGVIFTDAGTVERDFEFGKIRTSVGTGVRLMIPALGNVPFSLDVAYPINKHRDDVTRIFSISLGMER